MFRERFPAVLEHVAHGRRHLDSFKELMRITMVLANGYGLAGFLTSKTVFICNSKGSAGRCPRILCCTGSDIGLRLRSTAGRTDRQKLIKD
jgi:hypothetical protein